MASIDIRYIKVMINYLVQNMGKSRSLKSGTKSKYGRQTDVGLFFCVGPGRGGRDTCILVASIDICYIKVMINYLVQNMGKSRSLKSGTKSKYGRQTDVGLLYSYISDTNSGTQPLVLSKLDWSAKINRVSIC